MIKPGRIIKSGWLRYLPVGLIFFLSFFLLGQVLIHSHFFHPAHNLRQLPGINDWESLKPYSHESAQRYHLMLQTLSDIGYKRCDVYLYSKNCPTYEKGDQIPPRTLIEDRFLVTTKHQPVGDAGLKPYHTVKTLIVNSGQDTSDKNPRGKSHYIGIINFTAPKSSQLIVNSFNLILKNQTCSKFPVSTWYFIEDAIVLKKLQYNWRFQFKDPTSNLQIVHLNSKNVGTDVTSYFKKIDNCLESENYSE